MLVQSALQTEDTPDSREEQMMKATGPSPRHMGANGFTLRHGLTLTLIIG